MAAAMSPLRILWTLCLALLLPLGQAAAAAHELSHVQQRTEAPGKSGVQLKHCDACGLAAAVAGGAVPSAPAHVALLEFTHDKQPAMPALVPGTAGERYFAARAPPSSLHLP
jgi:hypothetical protein